MGVSAKGVPNYKNFLLKVNILGILLSISTLMISMVN